VVFLGTIRTQENPNYDTSCSSFSPSDTLMSAYEHSLSVMLRRPLRLAVYLYAGLVIWQSLLPAGTGGAIPHMDKLLHVIVYAVLAGGIYLAWPKLSKGIVLLICIAFGGMVEIIQGAMPLGRTASLWDGLANALGAVLAVMVLSIILRKFVHQA